MAPLSGNAPLAAQAAYQAACIAGGGVPEYDVITDTLHCCSSPAPVPPAPPAPPPPPAKWACPPGTTELTAPLPFYGDASKESRWRQQCTLVGGSVDEDTMAGLLHCCGRLSVPPLPPSPPAVPPGCCPPIIVPAPCPAPVINITVPPIKIDCPTCKQEIHVTVPPLPPWPAPPPPAPYPPYPPYPPFPPFPPVQVDLSGALGGTGPLVEMPDLSSVPDDIPPEPSAISIAPDEPLPAWLGAESVYPTLEQPT